MSNILNTLQTAAYVGTVILTIITLIGIFLAWQKKIFQHIKPFIKMANTINIFIEEILPDLITGFENKGILPQGTLGKWTTLMTKGIATSSLKQLNKSGKNLLVDSGIKNIIDLTLDDLIKKLEQENIKDPYSLEERCFYTLIDYDEVQEDLTIKKFVYENSEVNIYKLIFVGSLYLRNKYLEKYPELVPET